MTLTYPASATSAAIITVNVCLAIAAHAVRLFAHGIAYPIDRRNSP